MPTLPYTLEKPDAMGDRIASLEGKAFAIISKSTGSYGCWKVTRLDDHNRPRYTWRLDEAKALVASFLA